MEKHIFVDVNGEILKVGDKMIYNDKEQFVITKILKGALIALGGEEDTIWTNRVFDRVTVANLCEKVA
ncbi:hypothetical protein [Liquorilactobacillus cacaonum]|uniref:Uncharacterized protein n=1 Tax=Liquorilactobacillus cacaonum DSM 21116 TaxID=1423729 RepID=A0A0R2CJE2_9LACO|nr:hypothetical protein [Liquorilactobacillus cacaonum]KRM91477.1 hypothetical protein FC80_GL000443 [Liquorilactobacillus cacaonum DSM 21116]